ncbi:MAG: ABC transporter permease [Acidobacteriota bacterium]
MTRIVAMAREDLRLTMRDRSSIFWVFIAPLLWVYFFSFLAQAPDPAGLKIGLAVDDRDGTPASKALVASLAAESFEISPAGAKEGDAPPRSLTIPAGFGAAIDAKRKVAITISEQGRANPEGTLAARVALHKASVRMLAGKALGALDPADDAVTLRSSLAVVPKTPSGFYQTIPGNLVMFVLLVTLSSGAGLLAHERRSGVLRRLAISPLARSELIGGKIAGRLAIASVQILVFVVIGLTVFRIHWGRSPAGLALLLGSFALCASALSLLAGAVFASPEAAAGTGVVATLAMSALGGCWWPAEIMPRWMQAAAHAFPTAWAMDGLHTLLSWDGGLNDVLRPSGVLAVMAATAFALAVRRLRVEE